MYQTIRQAGDSSANEKSSECEQCRVNRFCLPPGHLASAWRADAVRSRIRVPRNENLVQAGDLVGKRWYATRFGSFKTVQSGSGGQEHVIDFSMSGEFLALAAFGLTRHPATVTALEDSEVCEVSLRRRAGAALPDARPFSHLNHLLSDAVRREQSKARLLRHTSSTEKIAGFLLTLSQRYAERGYAPYQFRLTMARGDIADFLGLTAESVSRLLCWFKRERVIEVQGRDIQLLDPQRLRDLSGLDRCAGGGLIGQAPLC